jgi:predicted Zn-dependent peptidase
VVDVTARPGVAPEQLEREVIVEIDRMRNEGVTQNEVDRAVSLIQTDFIASMQQAAERADQLSRFATYFGNPALLNEQSARFHAVTADEVNRFARARMGEDNRAFLMYVPRSEDAAGSTEESLHADAAGVA